MKMLNLHTVFVVSLVLPLAAFAAKGTMKGDGSAESPFQIEDYEDLKAIGSGDYGYSSNYIMTADIDASASASENCVLKGCHGFVPIGKVFGGTWDSTFSGKFDGKGHTISNLHISWAEDDLGLFAGIERGSVMNLNFDHAYIKGGEKWNQDNVGVVAGSTAAANITNVHVTNSTVQAYGRVGGIVGFADRVDACPKWNEDCEDYDRITFYTIMDNVSFQGKIYGYSTLGGIMGGAYSARVINSYADVVMAGKSSVGGIAGSFNHTIIKNSYSKGFLTPASTNAVGFGGIAGSIGTGIITRCYSTIDIRESSGGLLVDDAGGIAGTNINGYVEESFAMGSIKGKNNIGGLVGNNNRYIRNSFAMGSVQGDSLVGGLVGLNGNVCELGTQKYCNAGYRRVGFIDSSYSIGVVLGKKYVGGFVGANTSGYNDVLGCYWNTETSGLDTSSWAGNGDPLTTEEMLKFSSFVNWEDIGYDEYEVCEIEKCEHWNEASERVCPTGNYIKPWKIEEGKSFPYLAFNPYSFKVIPPIAVPTSGAKKGEEPKVASRLEVDGELFGIWLDWVSANDTEDSLYYGYRIGSVIEGDTVWGTSSYMAVPNKIEISTLAGLQKIGNDIMYPLVGNYELTADIDASSAKFKPIGDSINVFSGVFDGKGHTIKNLEIDAPHDNYVGLFGVVSKATIKDLTLKNGKVVGSTYVGAFAGNAESSTIQNVVSLNGDVLGVSHVGGLVGGTAASRLNVVAATGNVKGNETVGGLAGASASVITDAFSACVVKGYKDVGGVVGGSPLSLYKETEKSLQDVYSASLIKSPSANGISAPNTLADHETLKYCYFDSTVAGNVKDSEEGFPTAAMLKKSTYEGFDFDSVWSIQEGKSYPYFKGMDAVLPETLEDDGTVNMLAGFGTEIFPYEIASYEELKYVGKYEYTTDLYYRLVEDIDAGASAKENCDANKNCKGFEPIPEFSGTFIGDKHYIRNLHISRADEDSVGLFRVLASGAKVTGIILDTVMIRGKNYVGALAGIDKGSTLDSIFVYAEVYAKNYAGGITGKKTSGSMTRSSSKGYIDGVNYVGGIAGSLDSVTVTDCYSATFASGVENVGSMTGFAKNANVTNSYSAGGAYGTSKWGALVGEDSSSAYTNVYYVVSAWDLRTDVGKNIFKNEMSRWSYDGLDFKNTWDCEINWTLPYHRWYADSLNLVSFGDTTMLRMEGSGTEEDPFLLKTYNDLQSIGYGKYKLSAVYKLENDIDATISEKEWKNGYVYGFKPIGDNLMPIERKAFGLITLRDTSSLFTGKLLGNGHKITNLYMEPYGKEPLEQAAFISVIAPTGSVENLTFENVDFEDVGAVLTTKNLGTIKNVTVKGNIQANGALALYNAGTISDCYVGGTVSGKNLTDAGALVSENHGLIERSISNATVKSGAGFVANNYGTISRSYAAADVYGQAGFATNNYGTIENCYLTGNVYADSIQGDVGGFVAFNADTAKVSGFATGHLIYNGDTVCAALPKGTMSDAFYYLADGCSDSLVAGKALSQAEMLKKSSFEKLDFDSVWTIKDGGSYPMLRRVTNAPFAGVGDLSFDADEMSAEKIREKLLDKAFAGDSTATLVVELDSASEVLLDSLEKAGKDATGEFEISYRVGVLFANDTLWGRSAKTTIDLGESVGIAAQIAVAKFNAVFGSTQIALRFGLASAGVAKFNLLNMQGRVVRTFDLGKRSAGTHFETLAGEGLARGRYIGVLQVNGKMTEKALLLKR